MLQASAVGYYGDQGDEILDERAPNGSGFLAGVVRRWEESTAQVDQAGVRRAIMRTGLVLDQGRGFLPQFGIPFRLFLGGPTGSGRQWMPWIHIRDEVRAVRFLLEDDSLSGVINAVSPNPVQNREFAHTFGRLIGRPSWLPAPTLILRALLGKMADELLLCSQRAIPGRLMTAGFRFSYPLLEGALEDILNKRQ